MAAPALPQALQDAVHVLVRSVSIEAVDNIDRAPVDRGPAKQRRRATLQLMRVRLAAFVADVSDRDGYEAFLRDTLAGGALRFTWPRVSSLLPGSYGELQHLAKPTYQPEGDGWRISLDLLAMPTP